jgi:uncharacterized cupredoxin-like copper-binding protein
MPHSLVQHRQPAWRGFAAITAGALLIAAFALPAMAADDMPTIHLLMKDGRLFPETLEVPANTKFRLTVKNEGPGAAEFESLELRKETVLAPGVTRSLVFHPMKPGTYKFFDDFHPETAQGRIVAK